MKRESDENCQETDVFYQQEIMSNNIEQGDNFQETNNSSELTDHRPTNPSKRQRRSDDEEIRLLIPSKVINILVFFS